MINLFLSIAPESVFLQTRNYRPYLSSQKIAQMILQLGIIFVMLALGELIINALNIPIPSSIIGMLLLTASLQCGIIKLSNVEKTANFLLKNLVFFFIPAAVGIINEFGILFNELLPIVGASIGSTAIIIIVTGHVYQVSRKIISHYHNNHKA